MSGAEVRAEGLVRTFAVPDGPAVEVLRGVSFRAEAGATLAVTGPSGSGKTTLLQILGSLDRADAGKVWVGGREIGALDDDARAAFRNRDVGFVFQAHHLLPQLTALENVLVPAWSEPANAVRLACAKDLLGRVGLAERMNHFPGQLSGGERQRVALARALVMEPSLLLADEPTGALDQSNAQALVDLLLALNAEAHTTLIVVTHSEACARRMGRHLRLENGVLSE